MQRKNKIRVLIVDDSKSFREMVVRNLSADPQIQVIATAGDAFEARDKILKYDLDVLVCDVEMPRMSGIEFIKRLLPQYPLPVVMISDVQVSIEARKVGAWDCVEKPTPRSMKTVENFMMELIQKICLAAGARNIAPKRNSASDLTTETLAALDQSQSYERLIAIGASTGGTEAIFEILKKLPGDCPGILIVQHIPPVFSKMFAERLDSQTPLRCKEAQTGDYLQPGRVYVAPGDQHMRIKRIGKKYRVEVFAGEKVNGHCPSVDMLFDSVAQEAGNRAIGVLLTGMGNDGAKGLLDIRCRGGFTIGQDEASSVVYGMNKVAYNIGAVAVQSALENIHHCILTALKE
ncbi:MULTISPECIES: chemotaxis response regulator protein-glutamate methylesterase [Acetobacterium]|jgi:two-component system chemotaxis response regulator CheB|uniref:protein-glutamate methylesterase/protein-glutamine glutaminase n=1 Tax=Acetobacterium TaxID=33951 RepID=UPI001D646FD2|nr:MULTISPECIES: chemotaxis response regulator protein-glutamate methylesterase [Acetobacterium]MEA4806349.1 chemotaxis response regulator protein-glutamate methylesterase [Acetobacterium wieringae]VUZ28322.1 Chemotaxis response regulator protein-glutamate methylesterase [Acetobacterium wieringae]